MKGTLQHAHFLISSNRNEKQNNTPRWEGNFLDSWCKWIPYHFEIVLFSTKVQRKVVLRKPISRFQNSKDLSFEFRRFCYSGFGRHIYTFICRVRSYGWELARLLVYQNKLFFASSLEVVLLQFSIELYCEFFFQFWFWKWCQLYQFSK